MIHQARKDLEWNYRKGKAGVLPNLLVISDVSPEKTAGGALVLFRLLENYPAEKLLVIGRPSPDPSSLPPGLPGVRRHFLPLPIPRRLLMRVNPWWPVMMISVSRKWVPAVKGMLGTFIPESVLSVVQDHMCFLSGSVARDMALPLHLICHDDWAHHQTIRHSKWTKKLGMLGCDWALRGLLRQAASIQCVSQGMVENYQARYGVNPDLLPPCRGSEVLRPGDRPPRTSDGTPVLAYAGNIHHPWIARSLEKCAEIMGQLNGYLDIYSPEQGYKAALQWGLASKSARFKGFFPPEEFARKALATADGLFLPASFEPADRLDVSTLFPSKLVDYTGIGLPVIMWGPEYSTAARWVKDHPGSAELILTPGAEGFLEAVVRICDPVHGSRIGLAGRSAGDESFDLDSCRDIFFGRLTGI